MADDIQSDIWIAESDFKDDGTSGQRLAGEPDMGNFCGDNGIAVAVYRVYNGTFYRGSSEDTGGFI